MKNKALTDLVNRVRILLAQKNHHSIPNDVSTSFLFVPLFYFVFLTSPVADEDAPSGMLARGHYTAVSTFIDDDKHKHLEFEWSFDIAKDW